MLVRYHRGLREFRRGAFFTAVNTGLPVLPMAIVYRKPRGLRALLQKKRPYMCIRIGEPQYPDAALKRNDSIMELMRRTQKVMVELMREPPSDNQGQTLPEEDLQKAISL
jgi:1-acyl-sn-glycerol-3-phosphate acyltransferase